MILNLVNNAITHAPGSRYIDVELRRLDGQAELRVHDEGPGIPAADLPHLFSRFYQVSRKHGGSERGLGLGLYIAREIVAAHGGEIRVTSVDGEGSTFIVTLPVEQPAAALASTSPTVD
jgi:two-component system CheB/CheR fusion protein